MKKLVLLILAIFLTVSLFAQVSLPQEVQAVMEQVASQFYYHTDPDLNLYQGTNEVPAKCHDYALELAYRLEGSYVIIISARSPQQVGKWQVIDKSPNNIPDLLPSKIRYIDDDTILSSSTCGSFIYTLTRVNNETYTHWSPTAINHSWVEYQNLWLDPTYFDMPTSAPFYQYR